MTEDAKARGIKLLMLHIPREVMEPQAVEKGDIRFFELAYLEADVHKTSEVSETSEVWIGASPQRHVPGEQTAGGAPDMDIEKTHASAHNARLAEDAEASGDGGGCVIVSGANPGR